ncbi:MAG: sulfite exporter TauE/SafE family protein [Calditrichaeota bacterium]|nr:sulfite exporter TauE/SafE family protein [Calditrichota bacterium]
MLQTIGILLLGFLAGYWGGLVGLGGGVIVLPVLVLLFGMSQHVAQGTTLAMLLPPIGILAVITYHQKGLIDWRVAGLLCAGFVLGGWLGARLAVSLPTDVMRKVFAAGLFVISLKMFFYK